MKKLLLLALLCFSVNSYSFNWKKIDVDEFGSAQYIDVDDIKKKKGLNYYMVLINSLNPSSDGTSSSIGKWKVSCVDKKITWLSLTSYSQPMGKGRITNKIYHSSNLVELTPNKILYPKPNSAYYNLMKFVCDPKNKKIIKLF